MFLAVNEAESTKLMFCHTKWIRHKTKIASVYICAKYTHTRGIPFGILNVSFFFLFLVHVDFTW